MRVYVVTDLEGVAGVYQWENRDDTSLENHERRMRQRRWLAEEVNAMADGFRRGGVDDVWVNDGQGPGYSIDLDYIIQPGVRIEHGHARPFYCCGLDEQCSALGSLGTHARAGTSSGNLSHTMSGAIRGYWINDICVGETGYQAFLAGHFDVPFIFCAGDAWACREMEELCPGCVTVAVKVGLSATSALTVPPLEAREMICEGAQEAVKRIGQVKPLKIEGPVVFREEWHEPRFDPENPPATGRIINSRTREIEAEDMVDFMYKMYGYDPDYRPLWVDHPEVLPHP